MTWALAKINVPHHNIQNQRLCAYAKNDIFSCDPLLRLTLKAQWSVNNRTLRKICKKTFEKDFQCHSLKYNAWNENRVTV